MVFKQSLLPVDFVVFDGLELTLPQIIFSNAVREFRFLVLKLGFTLVCAIRVMLYGRPRAVGTNGSTTQRASLLINVVGRLGLCAARVCWKTHC